MKYDHKSIEKKWQDVWEKHWHELYGAEDFSSKPKYYVLIEFPYPSGEGLHMGHPRSYTALDIIARKRRMEGYNVLYPIGWDAFGLPAENYAIKTGQHPRITTQKNIATFRRQLQSLGLSFDWDREVDTTDPKYYRWTQWMFLKFYNHDLAYKAKIPINWCPKDKIGLANEEVIGGNCERCGTPVEKRDKEQWMIRITKYADQLIDDLKIVDYWDKIKQQQIDWIGRSEGAEITFPLNGAPPSGDVVFASNNEGKLKRMQKLFKEAGLKIILKTPKEIGVHDFAVKEDGKTLAENAEKKARALAEKTDRLVLADDSGFFIDGMEIDPVTVKRNALTGVDEKFLSIEEIGARMQKYYQEIAASKGGTVDAEWRNAFCLITPEKFAVRGEAIRPVVLTDKPHGTADSSLPLRPLYKSKATGKYVLEQTEEEEMIELYPITECIKKLFTPAITVFTTRPDTLFGATYMVLAPEHPFANIAVDKKLLKNNNEVAKYIAEAKKKSEIDRTAEGKEKTGVELKGVKAINPANGKEIPIFVADYVLGGYGTGAIMAVPAHDARDFAFAQKYGLPIVQVVAPNFFENQNPPRPGKTMKRRKTVHVILRRPSDGKILLLHWKGAEWGDRQPKTFLIGGIEGTEDIVEAAKREILEETGYRNVRFVKDFQTEIHTQYFAAHKDENRQADIRVLAFELENEQQDSVAREEIERHTPVWVEPSEVPKTVNVIDGGFVWNLYTNEQCAYTGDGTLINSESFNDIPVSEAKEKIVATLSLAGAAKKTITYKLRDWVFSRQRYWGEPIPIIHCSKCGTVPVSDDQLPVLLPEVEKYEPTDTGESPLAAITEWVNTSCPKCGQAAKRETDVMPNWAGSSWYFLRYCDPHNDQQFAASEKLKYWMPINWYNGGMEHTTLHLLYSRFWNKFLFDIGFVPTSEPYTKRTSHGLILAEDREKMSKSRGNVINPDSVIEEQGADTLRCYEMFIGPFDQPVSWSKQGVIGVRRFLDKVYELKSKVKSQKSKVEGELERIVHKTVKKVTEDIEALKFNTAMSQMMVCANAFVDAEEIPKNIFELFLKVLSLFAPHLAEELWNHLGHTDSITKEPWPAYDPELIRDLEIELVVQINGKVRDRITVPSELSEDELKAKALTSEKVQSWLQGKQIKQVVVARGKLVNIVAE